MMIREHSTGRVGTVAVSDSDGMVWVEFPGQRWTEGPFTADEYQPLAPDVSHSRYIASAPAYEATPTGTVRLNGWMYDFPGE